ncbi:hypothetical protein TcWFU_008423 [Taenia crassiceps]
MQCCYSPSTHPPTSHQDVQPLFLVEVVVAHKCENCCNNPHSMLPSSCLCDTSSSTPLLRKCIPCPLPHPCPSRAYVSASNTPLHHTLHHTPCHGVEWMPELRLSCHMNGGHGPDRRVDHVAMSRLVLLSF